MSQQILVATRKGLFVLERRAAPQSEWWKIKTTAFLGHPVTMVLADARDGSLYAALNLGHFGVKLHRSRDGGENWQECAVPVYPPQPENLPPPENEYTKVAPWSLVQIWSLESDRGSQAGGVWAGTIPGGLFHSADGGQSWNLVRSLWDRSERLRWFGGGYDYPGIHSISVDPRDSNHLTVAVSCGGVWKTRDRGETWDCASQGMRAAYMPPEQQNDPVIQDPHRLVHSETNPDVMWVQHHNGIFRSIDGAASWQEITGVQPSAFGFAVAVHPADPQTAWFVPAIKDECRLPVDARLVVTRTRDGGKTFEALGRGLPQENCYHLVYRHCLEVDASGQTLALGSTTGGLWTSDDQGDSWDASFAHLPPIYCVRMA
ncbi:MAG: exo-alpha-sialidase [Acidobacteriota bacterium]